MARRAMYQMFGLVPGVADPGIDRIKMRARKKKELFFSISRPTGDRAFCPVRYVSPVKEKGAEVAGVIFASSESPIESATEIERLIPSISKTCRNFKLKNARSFKGRMYSKGTKSFYYGFMSQN